jgi:hypothetical protein
LQQRRGRPPADPLVRENTRLAAENARLRDQLARQAKVLEVQGVYLASISTMYRLLRECGETGDRRRHATHPARRCCIAAGQCIVKP